MPSETGHLYWRAQWKAALENMPWMGHVPSYEQEYPSGFRWAKSECYRGRLTALRLCLGYRVYNSQGRSNAPTAMHTAIARGSCPRGQHRQRLLVALAGRHGAVIARVQLTQRDQAHRFKYWPK